MEKGLARPILDIYNSSETEISLQFSCIKTLAFLTLNGIILETHNQDPFVLTDRN